MVGIIQEKFEVRLPSKSEAGESWVSAKSARRSHGAGNKLNCLPPGQNISDQYNADIREQATSLAGEGDVSDDTNSGALKSGFTKRQMRATDDMYTNEHNDAFYDDLGGYVERNNVLDRL